MVAAPPGMAFQEPRRPGPPPASPLLPPDHWAVHAADRLEQLGLVDRWLPAQKAVPIQAVAEALADGVQNARRRRPDLLDEVTSWFQRFTYEFRLTEGTPSVFGAHMGVGYEWGHVRPVAVPSPLPAALHLEAPPSSPYVELGASGGIGPHFALGGTFAVDRSDARFPDYEAVAALGPFALSVGRARVGYGFMETGGLVFSGLDPLDRIEIMTTAPLQFPGALSVLGLFTIDTFLSRLTEARHPYSAVLWGTSLQWRPHQRFTVGVQRGFMFGGAPWAGRPLLNDVEDLLAPWINEVGNNVYSLGARWRLPTEALLPLTFRAEWGTDDNPRDAVKAPGLNVGLSTPRLPGIPASLGVEYAFIGHVTSRPDFPWYSHGQYVGGWATGEGPFGDPLGGNGNAVRVTATVFEPRSQVRATVTAWTERRFQLNLYGPGSSRTLGARGDLVVPLGGPFEASARGEYREVNSGAAASLLVQLTGYL